MTTGQRIKAARKKAKLTQKELGAKLGIAYQTLAQWENDLRNPKVETLDRIAVALGVSLSELLSEDMATLYRTGVEFGYEGSQLENKMYARYLEGIGYSWTKSEQKIISAFSSLNAEGQEKAIERMEELTEIPKYTVRFEALTPEERHLANTGQWQELLNQTFGTKEPPENEE